ncbi:uncharacterized protein EAF02_000454 [Botrytis sinoallii]|uniref:uncharacterized protein n=1 Tax=Botrytis sinoallii TaxID=1463999 RepID=UPI0018FF7866|nr:uncharacterized protein EAF02_000454 [Botrytis sinoallii]KAF7892916.1 hypothetical protein EAF02_000454 [Botrytis sinoallii]
MLPAILILNDRYYPSSKNSPAKVGATAFALQVIRVLEDAGLFGGVILYDRQDHLAAPVVTACDKRFNTMRQVVFQFWHEHCASPTDTLLRYHPKRLPYCVTHHGPFYGDFTRHFTEGLAAIAYGSENKASHLAGTQEEGLRHLKASDHAYVLQHSNKQGDYLMERGIDPARIRALNPPIHSMRIYHHHKTANIEELVFFSSSERNLIFTAVARLDYFKNVELLVDSAVSLLDRGKLVRLLIVGGEGTSDTASARLIARVPQKHSAHVKITSKIPKDDMYALFDFVRTQGIFVCTSRYETLGITPLEAALSGVTTVMPDCDLVEASRYFPSSFRFDPSVTGLSHVLEGFLQNALEDSGRELQRFINSLISKERFVFDLLTAWSEFSQLALKSLASSNSTAYNKPTRPLKIRGRRYSM